MSTGQLTLWDEHGALLAAFERRMRALHLLPAVAWVAVLRTWEKRMQARRREAGQELLKLEFALQRIDAAALRQAQGDTAAAVSEAYDRIAALKAMLAIVLVAYASFFCDVVRPRGVPRSYQRAALRRRIEI